MPVERQVFSVDEAPLLEERPLYPADEILDGALLLWAVGPAELDVGAEGQHDVGERRVPLGHLTLSVPLDGDGLRAVEDEEEWDTAEGIEVIDKRAHQRLDTLVLDERHLDHP
jgi:hypothetical protein